LTATRVLIADDSLVIRAVLRKQLQGQGFEVFEAADGEEALEIASGGALDVILLDVEMPILDGYEVLALLKADPELITIPVVFITARASTEDVVSGLRSGAHDYLRKPFEASEVIARVSAAARMKSLQDELRSRNEELDLLSRTDKLTELSNRRHLEEQAMILLSSSRRHNHSLGVLMIDIDRFKSINDSVGHAGGDDVLREVARRLSTPLRVEDVCGRWGGEEFLILLPITSLEEVELVGDRIRQSIASTAISISTGANLDVTISVGCASGRGASWESLVERADSALYEAKETGRNRVVAASDGPILERARQPDAGPPT
jgi:two-component system, cell cycle response regulator